MTGGLARVPSVAWGSSPVKNFEEPTALRKLLSFRRITQR